MITLFSPAKLNLFLRVLHRRSDGYHELASLFQAIDLGDRVSLCKAERDQFTCNNPDLLQNNLVIKALELFRRKSGLHTKVAIHLEKEIPMMAGLGGGSSNAATTLWALNALHDFPFSEEQLQHWSAEIGSDIPFFFSHGTAYCCGRGEIVTDLGPLPQPAPLHIIKPRGGLSTAEIYRSLDLSMIYPLDPQELLLSFKTSSPIFHNDLEQPAFAKMVSLKKLKLRLLEKYKVAVMTGSGSAFFCFGEHEEGRVSHFLNRKADNWY